MFSCAWYALIQLKLVHGAADVYRQGIKRNLLSSVQCDDLAGRVDVPCAGLYPIGCAIFEQACHVQLTLSSLVLARYKAWQHATVNVFSSRCNYCELCVRGSRLLPMLDDMDVCMASTQKNYLFCGVQNDVLKWRANM